MLMTVFLFMHILTEPGFRKAIGCNGRFSRIVCLIGVSGNKHNTCKQPFRCHLNKSTTAYPNICILFVFFDVQRRLLKLCPYSGT